MHLGEKMNSWNFLCASEMCSLLSLSLLLLRAYIQPTIPTFIPKQLLGTMKSSFMMYLQPFLNLHSCHHVTDSHSHHLIVRYYENPIKWSPCLLCSSLSCILHASEGLIFPKYCSGNPPKITLGSMIKHPQKPYFQAFHYWFQI